MLKKWVFSRRRKVVMESTVRSDSGREFQTQNQETQKPHWGQKPPYLFLRPQNSNSNVDAHYPYSSCPDRTDSVHFSLGIILPQQDILYMSD